MPDLDPTEVRLREELHAIGAPLLDAERLVSEGHRRARRRTARRSALAGIGVVGMAALVVTAVVPRDPADTVTDATDLPPTPTSAPLPPNAPLGEDTTWPGGPFDPIDGMAAVPDRTPLSDDQAEEIYDAENRLVAACMAEQVFESGSATLGNSVGAPPLYLSPDELRSGGFDYEYDWEAAGEEFLGNSDGSPDPTAGMTEEESEAYETALFGTSADDVRIEAHDGSTSTSSSGCLGEARAQLYGSVANGLRYNALLEPFSHVDDQLRQHEEYTQPLAAWQACMLDAGFDVGDQDYGASYIRQAGAAALSDDGREQTRFTAETIPAIAAADADCQESSGLYEVRTRLLDSIHEEIAADLGVDLDHYVAYTHALYERARRVP